MDIDDNFEEFLIKYDKLKKFIRKKVTEHSINNDILAKNYIHIDNLDERYNKLLIDKLTENLFNKKIIKLLE